MPPKNLDSINTRNERAVLNIINLIELHLNDCLKINDIIHASGYKKRHTQSIFKKMTGATISQYIIRRRLSKAAIQLKYTNKKIIDISIECNYQTLPSFYKAFKKMFRTTPENYRNNKDIDFSIFQGNFNERNNNYSSLGILEMEFFLRGDYFTYNESMLEKPNPLNSQKKYKKIIKAINTHGEKIFTVTKILKKSDVENVIYLKVFLGKLDSNGTLQLCRRRYYGFHFSGHWQDYVHVVRDIYMHGCFLKGAGDEVECFYRDTDSILSEDKNELTALLYIPASDI